MKILHSLSVAALATALITGSAWASDDAYVCSIRVDTGFSKASSIAFPHTDQMKLEATLTTEPYCQGTAAGTIKLETPVLEVVRSRKLALNHSTKIRNVWQASLATLQVLSIASAQGAPLSRATVVATNVEEEPAHEYAFQATRPASSTTQVASPPVGKNGETARGYVCVSTSKD